MAANDDGGWFPGLGNNKPKPRRMSKADFFEDRSGRSTPDVPRTPQQVSRIQNCHFSCYCKHLPLFKQIYFVRIQAYTFN